MSVEKFQLAEGYNGYPMALLQSDKFSWTKGFYLAVHLNMLVLKDLRGVRTIETKKLSRAIFYGVLTIFIFAALTSLIFSLLLRFTSLQEHSIQYVITGITFLAMFLGGFISGGKGKERGWLVGGLTGVFFTLIILLFQYLGYDSMFTLKELVYHACFIITAMMGGILGVNITSSRAS
ncbi:TIGR04086 family membrane protein [Bacillus litorisediminis]|uniref:TIGR04086 family membrane protein n=1 Tax=Bacillus litorisediminis TaxID=2922713 RepID=UPI0028BDCA9D|nr:TIGR04086 family membrane protein [Bacillus litorisediminis]